MLRFKLVKTAEAEDAMVVEDSSGMLHGAAVLHELVNPWRMTNRIVYADSYLAYVQAAESLMSVGLRFVGVVKKATKRFLMQVLAEKELDQRGDRIRMVCLEDDKLPFAKTYPIFRTLDHCSGSI